MENKVLYFGYGANRDIRMMEAITGNKNLNGQPADLKGFTLVVQRKNQIPDTVLTDAPAPLSPRSLLEDWPDNFESYNIKPGAETDEVSGTIWELTPLERDLVRDWELIDFGWYKDLENLKAITQDGKEITVETEGLREDQEIARQVNGKSYETFLMPIEDFQRIAIKTREEFLARLQEGELPNPEKR